MGWYDYLMWYGNLNFWNGLGGMVISFGTSIRYLKVVQDYKYSIFESQIEKHCQKKKSITISMNSPEILKRNTNKHTKVHRLIKTL